MTYKSEDVLRELYWEQGLKMSEIADQFDIAPDTVRYWMNKFDIERRPKGTQHTGLDVETMVERYKAGESSVEIATDYPISSKGVRNRIEKAGHELRSLSESQHNRHDVTVRTSVTGGYPSIKCTSVDEEVYVHRLNAVAKGYDPDEVQEKDVHHADQNPWNNSLDNIELLTKSEHGLLHSK